MAFNFPDAPAEDQVFTPSGGPTYVYKAPRWLVQMAPAAAGVTTDDAAPSSPVDGQLWYKSNTGDTYIWYVDPSGVPGQWVQVNVMPATGSVPVATAQTRNRIVNGAMQISQENGNTAATTANYYAADQFDMLFTHGGTSTAQRVQSVTPNGSANRFRITMTVADAALAVGDNLWILHSIEGIKVADFRWGLATAKQVVLRFGWKSPAGTYSIALMNDPRTRGYIANFTISAGQANTDTEQVFAIPGDTIGTWSIDNSRGIQLGFVIATGTSFQGVTGWQGISGAMLGTSANTNGMATAGAVFELYDVGLYLDPQSTGVAPAWQMPDEAEELRACQRYWSSTYALFSANVTTATAYYAATSLPSSMRGTPALSGTSTGSSSFPNTVGTLAFFAPISVRETRTASATAAANWSTFPIIANARM